VISTSPPPGAGNPPTACSTSGCMNIETHWERVVVAAGYQPLLAARGVA